MRHNKIKLSNLSIDGSRKKRSIEAIKKAKKPRKYKKTGDYPSAKAYTKLKEWRDGWFKG